ncbi:hypothetical protein F4777DRAFT_62023 [Nemania sp. FL0916]|nr:hypothetical protein F4777DRAFT_62023 [Nemania sp. FL0916]
MFRTTDYLIPNVIRRRQDRLRPFAAIVGVDGTYQTVTFADLENYSNRAAWVLEKLPSRQVLYMGPNDVRYVLWAIAAFKAGKCVLFPSLANQVSANERFFATVGCNTLLYAPEAESILAPLMEASRPTLECIASPTYSEMMSKETAPVFPYEATFDQVQRTPFLGLHTSGTSGHPKPIYWNPLAVSALASFLDSSIVDADGHNSNLYSVLLDGNDVFVPFPLSHFGGMGNVIAAIYSETTLVFPAPGTRLSPDNIALLLQHSNSTAAVLLPSLLEGILHHSSGLAAVARLKHVAYTGGPLNPLRGKVLAKKLPHLFTILASTEGGISHLVATSDSTYWDSFRFVDVGQRMDEIAPGIFELVFPRSELVNKTYALFHTHPHLDVEFRTSDLFSKLEKENENEHDGERWVYRGRADNWIAMSNGLKMDPTETENAIASHPVVTGVVMAGSYRFRLCLLVELVPEAHNLEHEKVIKELWPIIAASNRRAPKFGRVPRELVLFATPEKPFLRAGKGTVQRRLTVQAYEKEINDLYTKVEEGLFISGLTLPSSLSVEGLMPFLEALCTETLLDDPDSRVSVDDDLSALGLDSLAAFVLLARLKAALRKYGVEEEKIKKVDNKLLFSATTIRQLASELSRAVGQQSDSSDADVARVDLSRLVQQYESRVLELVSGSSKDRGAKPDAQVPGEQVVILTGSTGSLGSYILCSLLSCSAVKKVFCLSRASSPLQAQAASFRSRGLAETSLHDAERVKFLQIEPSAPHFGLPNDKYALIAREATHIIHNAYMVNFLRSVEAFASQFDFLLQIMRLASECRHKPNIMLVSSITAAMCVKNNINKSSPQSSSVPAAVEERVLDEDVAEKYLIEQGYAQSKYVCEQMLNKYASATKNPASILRVGQVCGPVSSATGVRLWNPTEWLPSLVMSSRFMGAVPDSLGTSSDVVDWVPVDKLGEIVRDLVETSAAEQRPLQEDAAYVFNIVHPAPTSWPSLLPGIIGAIESVTKKQVDVVSSSEWLRRLQDCDRSPHVIHENPAIKLLDFFQQTMIAKEEENEISTPYNVEMANTLDVSRIGEGPEAASC